MYGEDVCAAAETAAKKVAYLNKNPLGFFLMSMMAGAFVGTGNLLTNTMGGQMQGAPATKILMGAAFAVALSLVVFAGSELFTGNNMMMALGMMKKKVTLAEALKLWVVCWIGNLAGAVVLSLLFHFSGLNTEATINFLSSGAAAKMAVPFVPLLIRGMLCNFLVCLAVWCGIRCKTESAKLIMIFWCLFAFVITGYEHSVANMTQLTAALLDPAGQAVSVGGYIYNLATVTLGNVIGGVLFVAVPYFTAAEKD
ncbi:MAG: formate/nitrite transporter family protein [Lachnospiraceae bacterium]|nr:formate/nitrite transporter family protein [Lachnospiraceae bacterium]